MKRALLLAVLALVLFASSARTAMVFESAERPSHLLEVYTSEGCSSCPPAELWLGALKGEPNLWKDFVPVVWHVDYWDKLGWRDILGSRRHSIRQKTEAGQVQATTYTPGFFLNGEEWRGFFDAQPLPPADAPPAGRLRATKVGPSEFIVEFTPTAADPGELEISAALMGMEILIPVYGGENKGQNLIHDFAVLASVSKKVSLRGGKYTARVTLINETEVTSNTLAAAFWVTPAGRFNALQATGGYLTGGER